MFTFIDKYLNRITMYRLVLVYLIFLWIIALIFSIFGLLPYSPASLVLSLAFITAVSWISNFIFAQVFKAPTNLESMYITALILVLIIAPFQPTQGINYLAFAAFASLWAMASKFIIAVGKKHIFNPAALAVALTALLLNQSANWWIGTVYMMPFVLVGGWLVVRKIQREDLAISFLAASLLTTIISGIIRGTDLMTILTKAIIQSPLLFFAFVMLTEPLTTPPAKTLRMIYGAIVGYLFSPATHLLTFYTTPETALLVGNVFSYLVSPKQKLLLTLKEKRKMATDVYDFVFSSDEKLNFRPGQYLEWTLGHSDPDSRGNRRYFTIASSPTENDIVMGVKFYPESSSFKRSLLNMQIGDTIIASQLAGEFVMPKDKNKKLVFIAGGIGITPFRSMIKYMIDSGEKRDTILLYSNPTTKDVAYKKIFDEAGEKLGLRTIYNLTRAKNIPQTWIARDGRLSAEMIREEVPDCMERTFYISGPHAMVVAFENVLKELGISKNQIKTDFFPGFV